MLPLHLLHVSGGGWLRPPQAWPVLPLKSHHPSGDAPSIPKTPGWTGMGDAPASRCPAHGLKRNATGRGMEKDGELAPFGDGSSCVSIIRGQEGKRDLGSVSATRRFCRRLYLIAPLIRAGGAGGRCNLARRLPRRVEEEAELFPRPWSLHPMSVSSPPPAPNSLWAAASKAFAHPPPFAFVPVAHLAFGKVKRRSGQKPGPHCETSPDLPHVPPPPPLPSPIAASRHPQSPAFKGAARCVGSRKELIPALAS